MDEIHMFLYRNIQGKNGFSDLVDEGSRSELPCTEYRFSCLIFQGLQETRIGNIVPDIISHIQRMHLP